MLLAFHLNYHLAERVGELEVFKGVVLYQVVLSKRKKNHGLILCLVVIVVVDCF